MDKERVIECMKDIVKAGKDGDYSPEEFKSAIDSVKLMIEEKVEKNNG